jgi:hypothetical protein
MAATCRGFEAAYLGVVSATVWPVDRPVNWTAVSAADVLRVKGGDLRRC